MPIDKHAGERQAWAGLFRNIMNILSLQITRIRPVLDQKDKKKRRRWNIWLRMSMRIEMPVRERELKILDVNLSGKR